jgi:endonuclease-3
MDRPYLLWCLEKLRDEYGPPQHKDPLDPLDELVLTILSQNTNDRNRDKAYSALKGIFPDLSKIGKDDQEAVEDAIRIGGLANTKSRNIVSLLSDLRDRKGKASLEHLRGMDPRDAFDELISIKGVGTKTAACVMVFSLGQPFFPVDTHIHRISIRLGLVPESTSRERTQVLLEANVPDDMKYDGHLLLIEHGRRTCQARSPHCETCALKERCPRIGVG